MAHELDDVTSGHSEPSRRPLRRRLIALIVVGWVGLGVALAAWAVSSPPGASPDDDFHLLSIFCSDVQSDPESMCAPGSSDTEVLAPASMVQAHTCYAFAPAESARCQTNTIDWDPDDLVPTERLNSDGLYPRGYYAFANRFVDDDIVASVKLMRFVNIAVVMSLWTLVLAIVATPLRLAFWSSIFVTSVPLGVYILASNNPSAWATGGIAALWVVTYQFMFGVSSQRRRLLAGLAMVLCCWVAFSARGDATVYAVVTFAAMFLLRPGSLRELLQPVYVKRAALPAVLSGWAAIVYLSANQGAAAAGGLQGGVRIRPISQVIVPNVLDVHYLWLGVWGALGGLNWLDTSMVPWVASLQITAGLVALITGIRFADRKKRLSLWLLGFVLFVLPTYLLLVDGYIVGEAVQSRYLLPLIYVVMGIALYRSKGTALVSFRTPVLAMMVAAVTIAHSMALHIQLRRFLTGTDVSAWDLNANVEWWWTSRVSPMTVWYLGSLGFAAFGMSAAWTLYHGGRLAMEEEQ